MTLTLQGRRKGERRSRILTSPYLGQERRRLPPVTRNRGSLFGPEFYVEAFGGDRREGPKTRRGSKARTAAGDRLFGSLRAAAKEGATSVRIGFEFAKELGGVLQCEGACWNRGTIDIGGRPVVVEYDNRLVYRTCEWTAPRKRVKISMNRLRPRDVFYMDETTSQRNMLRIPANVIQNAPDVWIEDRRSSPEDRRMIDDSAAHQARGMDACRANSGRRTGDLDRFLRRKETQAAIARGFAPVTMEIVLDTTKAAERLKELAEQLDVTKLKTQVADMQRRLDLHGDRLKELGAQGIKFEDRLLGLEAATGGLWKTQDGTLMAIRDMSDNHLANSIKLCEQRPSFRAESLSKLRAEQERRRMDKVWAARTAAKDAGDTMDFNTIRTCARKFMNSIPSVGKVEELGAELNKQQARMAAVREALKLPIGDPVEAIRDLQAQADRLKRGTRAGTGRTTRMLDAAIAEFDKGGKVIICTWGADRERLWNALLERLSTSTVHGWTKSNPSKRVVRIGSGARNCIRVVALPPARALEMVEDDLGTTPGIFIDHEAAERVLRARYPKLFEQIER